MDEIRIIDTKLWSILRSFCKVLSLTGDVTSELTMNEWERG